MSARARLLHGVIALAGAWAVPTSAVAVPGDVACVGIDRDACTLRPDTLTDALAAQPGLIFLGSGTFTGTFATATSVEIAGSAETVIRAADPAQPALALMGAANNLRNVRVDGRLAMSGTAGLADVNAGALRLTGADATARNITVTGPVSVAGGTLSLSSSVVTAGDPFGVSSGATVQTRYSAHAADPDAPAADRVQPPENPRPVPGSPLVDAGAPTALEPFEPFEDVAGVTRITDGDGDGVLRRDIGAYELQPPATPVPAGDVLVNGGAEQQFVGWTGSFATALYGAAFLPSERTGEVLGGGRRFFSGASAPVADMLQRIDVTRSATSIDRGGATATLSGLLGGYGADEDELTVAAVFRDPEASVLKRLYLPTVTPGERANGTNLLQRSIFMSIPPRTRAIEVVLIGDRQAGSYTDTYADNLSLVLSVPGVPVDPPVRPSDPPVAGLKPFSGVSVLTGQPVFSRRGHGRMLLLCASSTVGSCDGSLELQARLPQDAGPTRIARYSTFSIAPGRDGTVVVRLLAATRAKLGRRRTLRARLIAISRDGQALQRRATVPLRLRLAGGAPIRRRR